MHDSSYRKQPVAPDQYDETYFLSACEGYKEFLETEGEQLSRRLEAAFSAASVQPGMNVLDIGSGRGEIVRHCGRMGVHCLGVDYASAANRIAARLISEEKDATGRMGVLQSDAKVLPFPDKIFDRVLMFDIVEHLHPWELDHALREVYRVLKRDGRLIIHTAPNRFYDRYAYPVVRFYRNLTGEGGGRYPKNPREITPVNVHVHVNEQDILSLPRTLRKNGFLSRVWLDSPPQNRDEGPILCRLRKIAFDVPPFRWFFEREIFALAWKPPLLNAIR